MQRREKLKVFLKFYLITPLLIYSVLMLVWQFFVSVNCPYSFSGKSFHRSFLCEYLYLIFIPISFIGGHLASRT